MSQVKNSVLSADQFSLLCFVWVYVSLFLKFTSEESVDEGQGLELGKGRVLEVYIFLKCPAK